MGPIATISQVEVGKVAALFTRPSSANRPLCVDVKNQRPFRGLWRPVIGCRRSRGRDLHHSG